jgi:phosphoserine phosphatase
MKLTCNTGILIMFAARIGQALTKKPTLLFGRQAICMMSTVSPDSLLKSVGSGGGVGNNIAEAMFSLYNADAVCFDVDSTVIAEEGIDTLADYLGKGDEVAALTKQAMEGDTKFQDALKMRLDLMQPSKSQIETLLTEQPLALTDGIAQLMQSLQKKKVDVWLVSGGFRIMIEPIAKKLNIPITNIVANHILFDEKGEYAGFDKDEPTSRDMGKPKALEQIKSTKNYETMVMVGDGATDAQAKPPAKAFIGFGGIVERDAVKEKADWFVFNFDDMTKIVDMRP